MKLFHRSSPSCPIGERNKSSRPTNSAVCRTTRPSTFPTAIAFQRSGPATRRRLLAQIVGVTTVLFFGGCRPVPQVVNDEAVYKELDALYTAVTSHRRNLLDDSRERLTKLHKEGRLSDAGFTAVTAIVAEAEKDQWPDAAQHLYDFMRAQRKTKTAS